eukprot:386047_1
MNDLLLNQIELMPTTTINLENIRNNHEMLLNNNHDVSVKTQQIINAIGGIDIVLSNYFSNDNPFKLTTNQLEQINDIFISIKASNQKQSKPDIINDETDPILYFSAKNTFFHSIINATTATKIMNLIFGKVGIFSFGFVVIYSTIINVIETSTVWTNKHSLMVTLVNSVGWLTLIFAIIFLIFALLSLNKVATKKIVKTFEFWFKMFYFVRYWICVIIYMCRINDDSFIDMLYQNVSEIAYLLFFILYSCIDGLYPLSFQFKVIVLVTGCVLISYLAVYYTIVDNNQSIDENVRCLHVLGTPTCIDLVSMKAISMRILSIFVWKQSLHSLYYKDKSLLIRKRVTIKWLQ